MGAGLGVVVPIGIAVYGVHALISREAIYGHRPELLLTGPNASAVGTAALSLAMFMHCHYFWGNLYDNAWWAVLGKIIAGSGFIAGVGTMIVRVGVLGINS